MVIQKQIRLWITTAEEIFQKYMPAGTLPDIYIGAPRNILKLRAELVEKTKSRQLYTPDPYNIPMETIHGDAGDAILIQQKLVYNGEGAERYFYHCLWHEIGRYFAIYNECEDRDEYSVSVLHRYNDLELAGGMPDQTAQGLAGSEQAKGEEPTQIAHKILHDRQEGYWFWSEFIAESIANYVEEEFSRIDNADSYHPEQITWEPELWSFLPDRLISFLEMGFSYYVESIDEAGLAMYFATLLMSDFPKRYVQAAMDGKLKVYDNAAIAVGKFGATKLMEPGSIDPTCISKMPEAYQDILRDMKSVLEIQMQKKKFWEIDEHFLDKIGGCISSLEFEKSKRASS